MQLSGSFLQSVLQRNLSQSIHPTIKGLRNSALLIERVWANRMHVIPSLPGKSDHLYL